MRAKQPEETTGQRGATAQLTVAKHLLLDWLDSRLGSMGQGVDVRELQRRLTLEIRDAGLSCNEDGPPEARCPEWMSMPV